MYVCMFVCPLACKCLAYKSEAIVDCQHHNVNWSGVISNHHTPTLCSVLPARRKKRKTHKTMKKSRIITPETKAGQLNRILYHFLAPCQCTSGS